MHRWHSFVILSGVERVGGKNVGPIKNSIVFVIVTFLAPTLFSSLFNSIFRICASIEHFPPRNSCVCVCVFLLDHSLSMPCIHNTRFYAQSQSLSRRFIFIISWNKTSICSRRQMQSISMCIFCSHHFSPSMPIICINFCWKSKYDFQECWVKFPLGPTNIFHHFIVIHFLSQISLARVFFPDAFLQAKTRISIHAHTQQEIFLLISCNFCLCG